MSKDEQKKHHENFDTDENLKSKRKLLITISMILIALEVTGATIKEANTFLFKIGFTNESGVTNLLVFSILYLLVRYYSYAQPYHEELFEFWSSRMLKDPDFFITTMKVRQSKALLVMLSMYMEVMNRGFQRLSMRFQVFSEDD